MNKINQFISNPNLLWQYIKQYATQTGRETTRLMLELYYVVKAPSTPIMDKTIIIAALAYQLLPNDLMSRKKYGVLGFVDNAATLAIAYNRVKHRITPGIKRQVDTTLNEWFEQERT